MKKVFRKIQKGTTKMIERIKSLGEMETKQKCVVQRFEIIIPLHQKITTQYIASASFTCGFLVIADWTKVSLLLSLSAIMLTERK
ncbi:hypothetical protein NXX62_01940 [Bacteroides thetaiotaomicron]|nr:hypothetical protein [Bacteroides thetaiotaomicron]